MRILLILMLLASIPAFGQTTEVPKQISGGVLNFKATSLVRPEYPAAARAVRACGAVNVSVTIDLDGAVVSARAVSGHPLLRAAAVGAAKTSMFAPTTLAGKPVRVTGIIVYNFMCDLSLLEVGLELSGVERGADTFRGNDVANNLPAEWTEERAMVAEIAKLLAGRRMNTVQKEPIPAPETEAGRVASILEANQTSYAGTATPERNPEASAKALELIGLIALRVAAEGAKRWLFELGVIAGRLIPDANDEDTFRAVVEELAGHLDRAPTDVSNGALEKARGLLRYCRESVPGADRRNRLAELTRAL